MNEEILKRWEANDDKYYYFIEVTSSLIYIWQTMGAPITESGGYCSYENFIEGQYNDLVCKIFGNNVLEEINDFLKNLKQSNAD